MKLIDTQTLVMADTVGFIRQLPHDLVDSFGSTLEETRDAALLLHVVEAGANREDLMNHVNDVLEKIGADEVPQLVICNKIDQLENHPARLDRDENGRIVRVWLSAKTGEGLDLLRVALQEYFPEQQIHTEEPLDSESTE